MTIKKERVTHTYCLTRSQPLSDTFPAGSQTWSTFEVTEDFDWPGQLRIKIPNFHAEGVSEKGLLEAVAVLNHHKRVVAL